MQANDVKKRITFHNDLEIMEVDFSALTFDTSSDVNTVYDTIEQLIAATGRNWYFMVNYSETQINPDAWFQYALRGKNLNVAHSMGSVRFDPREPTRDEILRRARDENFNPNLVSNRDEALERIGEMKESA